MLVAKEGFEVFFQELTDKKAALMSEKDAAIEQACAKVSAEFTERETLLDELLDKISVIVPDEPVLETVSNTETKVCDNTTVNIFDEE